ncbi:MAG TPA: alpha/beta hydrolase [Solirubrobacteraceae bacterium]|nr:alpha/beta hydrolase [Solirubrobacteraceae bacterium]
MPEPTIVLVHSPLVGPGTWAGVAETLRARGRDVVVPSLTGVADAPEPGWRFVVERAREAVQKAGGQTVLAGHSGAGLLLPAIADGLDLAALLYVDASLPPWDAETVPLAPPRFAEQLGNMAKDGRLPPWWRWFPRKATKALVPDKARREALFAEMPSLPHAYFSGEVDVPSGWAERPSAYLRFTATYDARAQDAAERGWPVGKLDGVEHLAMVTHPDAVASALLDLESRVTAARPG